MIGCRLAPPGDPDVNCDTSLDTIAFNIPGTGVHTISPASALPAITNPVIIDGYTQPGASPNTLANGDNAVLEIVLDGAVVGADARARPPASSRRAEARCVDW